MPAQKLALILVIVIGAAGATIWLGTAVAASLQWSGSVWMTIIPVALVAFVIWRRIAHRHDP